MAYTRDEEEKLEIDYPLEKVWAAIPEATKELDWTIQTKDDNTHEVQIKTKAGFLSYNTLIIVKTVAFQNKTRMELSAETPVTTITSMADFGRTRDRIDQFIGTLAEILEKANK